MIDHFDPLVVAYVKSGRPEFKVTGIDMYRDGGTIQVTFNNQFVFDGSVYSHKKDRTWHYGFPSDREDKIEDEQFIAYLEYQITVFVNKSFRDYTSIEACSKKLVFNKKAPE